MGIMGWLPGQSGNPGGRPRARFDLLARERTAEAIATSVRVMRQKTNPAAAARAAEILLGRGWSRGKLRRNLQHRVSGKGRAPDAD
jgi:Family of unknown function (DUF5681)